VVDVRHLAELRDWPVYGNEIESAKTRRRPKPEVQIARFASAKQPLALN
jgi:hypothetical protein